MSLACFSLENRIFVSVLYLLCLGLGIFSARGAIVDVYPDVSFDAAQVVVVWPGAAPSEIESSVTRRLEDEIEDVAGIDRFISSSERDRCILDVKFREDLSDEEFQRNFEDLRAAVQRVRDLPPDAERPQVRKITVSELYPLLTVVVTSELPDRLVTIREVARELRERLQTVDGVLRVADLGIPEREWKVFVDEGRLKAAGFTLLEVVDRLRARHVEFSAGSLAVGRSEVTVGTSGEVGRAAELLDLILVARPDGTALRLRDVATVVEEFEKPDHIDRYNGRPCINLAIAKNKEAHALDVKARLLEVIRQFRQDAGLPADIETAITIDTTLILKNRISVLVSSLGLGIVLVFFILWLFLGLKNSLLAILGIPFSFLLAYSVLHQMGVTINAITLFSLVLVSGMVVDDAIVVLENIYRHVSAGVPLHQAIITGVGEVAWPVLSASLTTMAAFLPLLLTEGVVGEFMSIIPKTVALVLLASLFECVLLLPAHYAHRGEKKPPTGVVRATNALFDRLGVRYARLLDRLLQHPGRILAFNLALAAVGMFLSNKLPVELFPSDFQAFYANIYADPESGLETTSEAVREVEKLVAQELGGRVDSFTTSVGVTFTDDNQVLVKPSVAQLLVYANEDWSKDHDPMEIIQDLRKRTDGLVRGKGEYRFQRIKVDTFQDGPPTGKPVAVRIATPDYGEGKALAREFVDFLGNRPGVFSISDNLDEGPLEMRLVPKEDRLAESAVPFAEAARLLFAANEGIEIGELLPAGEEEAVTLRVQLDPRDRKRPEAFLDLDLRQPTGTLVPLESVARFAAERSPAALYHYDGQRVVTVTADVDTKVTDSQRTNEAMMAHLQTIQSRYPGATVTFGGEFEETKKSFDSQKRAFFIALLLVYAILVAQFRSFSVPLVVMTVVPFSFIGVVLGLWILDLPFTIMTFIAIVGLSGVVVNDSIVLVEFITEARRRGESMHDAVLAGVRTRLRPIFLTTLTTVLGLLPTALGLTGKSKIWSPFAATISFGLLLAMFLTLFLVPAVFVFSNRIRIRFARKSASAA